MNQKVTPPVQAGNMNPNDYRRKSLGNTAERAYRALVVNAPVEKIPESTFVKEILPYYCGNATNLELPKLVAAAAGGPFNEYDVVDAAGNILFRAPALLERRMFDFKEANKGLSMEAIFQTAQMLMNRSPMEAENFINVNLTRKGFSKNASEIFKSVIERRDEIMKRYGVTLAGSVSTATSNNSSTVETTKPDFNPDDFDML